MKPSQVTLFSASAGSGKTYTLTIEYIKMALCEVESKGYFRRILAVTFTIKAAEEMRQRILQFLAGISDYPSFHYTASGDQPKILSIIDKIQSELAVENYQLTREEIASRAAITLQQILQDYGLFSVMTIDSFVQRLSSSFIEELNLPSHFEVLLDSKSYINDLINQLVDKVNGLGNPELNELMLSFANKEMEEGRSLNRLRESLYDFLKISLEENYLAVEPHLSQFNISDFHQLEYRLANAMLAMVQEVQQVASCFLAIIDNIGVEDSMYFQGSKGPVGIMRSILTKNKITDDEYKHLHNALHADNWVSSKASKEVKELIHQHKNELSECVQQFLALQSLYIVRYNFLNWVLKDLKKIAFLNLIQDEMQSYQQDHLTIPISEFAKRVYEVISTDPIPFIYEKLGDRYFHILIDEFQDTSLLQWKNFMPLIENATSVGKRSLLVGDAKQSIYKFRGGEVSLIASLATKDNSLVSSHFKEDSLDEQRFDYLLNQVHPKALNDNYRSAKEVVEFNNGFYQSLAQDNGLLQICPLLSPLYGHNLVQNPKVTSEEFSGRVDLLVYNKAKENFGFTEPENEFMYEQVLNLIQHNLAIGFRYQDIAILTRKNKHSRFLAVRLKEKGIPVISSDSLLVHYSPVVGFLLSYLSLYDNPTESLFLYELVYQFAEISGNSVTKEDLTYISQHFSNNHLEKANSYFLSKGYVVPVFTDLLKWVYELVSVFDLLNNASGQDYLWKFLDVLNEYVVLKDKSVNGFLVHFNQNRNSYCISSSSEANAVTISSIHKSKGLEYPVVILPFLNWTFAPDNEKIWYDLSEVDVTDLEIEDGERLNFVYGRVNSPEPAAYVSLADQIQKEKEAIFLDALNMLYVATTRPKQALHLLLSVPTEEMHSKTISAYSNSVGKLVYEFVKERGQKLDLPEYLQTGCAWSSEYYQFLSPTLLPKIRNKSDNGALKNIQIIVSNTHPPIAFRVNSSLADLYTSASQKREMGNQLHHLLAQLPDVSDWPEIRYSCQIDVSKIDDLLAMSEVKLLFNQTQLAFKEVDILCPDGRIIRPDRVNKVGDALQVIDFKTGKKKPEHFDQVNRYKQTLVDMGYQVTKGVLLYIETREIVYV